MKLKKNISSIIFLLISIFLFYGAYVTFNSTQVNSNLKYTKIAELVKLKEEKPNKCLDFYQDSNRGGILLDVLISIFFLYF